MINWNPNGDYPQIADDAYIYPTAVIIGKVSIGKNVFVGPTAVIRADEPGSSIIIKNNCNVQDRVIIHALEKTSVLIDENTSLAHGCIVHGPCRIGKNSFVGFGSVVFDSVLEDGVVVKHLCSVEGVNVASKKIIESGQMIKGQKEANNLKLADKQSVQFAKNVVKVNLGLTKEYGHND